MVAVVCHEAGFRANLVSPGSAVFACVDSMHVRRQIFRDFQEHDRTVFSTQLAELHNDQTLPHPPASWEDALRRTVRPVQQRDLTLDGQRTFEVAPA
jgi:hypothetical protein